MSWRSTRSTAGRRPADLLVAAADPGKAVANLRKLRAVMRSGVLRSEEEWKAVIAAGK